MQSLRQPHIQCFKSHLADKCALVRSQDWRTIRAFSSIHSPPWNCSSTSCRRAREALDASAFFSASAHCCMAVLRSSARRSTCSCTERSSWWQWALQHSRQSNKTKSDRLWSNRNTMYKFNTQNRRTYRAATCLCDTNNLGSANGN